MNTNKLKAYAPKARLAFMDAVKKRAAVLGIYENKIGEATTQGTDTLIEGRIFTRKQGQQRQQLVKRIEALGGGKDGYNQFINEMAFTWFNRFTAIRFMEVNGYLDHGFRMLSKEECAEFGQGFEILAHAADVAEDLGLNKADIVEMLLAGDKEEELYRELLLVQCHQLSKIMPFMFEKLDDATELLLPDNLTKTDSILKELVNDVPEDNWREIEVIGWLYQFYISEHKDAVIGKVVKKEDIPAATQLFTPNWIVKYLVQNSLGRQWLATYPNSELKDKMEYYITPAEQSDEVIEQLKAITPTSIDPEQIKVLDPACGSGHILVEVYEVLREIYLERGYRLREIPELILTKNIYGLDIDDRAAQMAAFAVLMKAREDDRRIFSRVEDNHIKLNIYAIQSTEHININKLWSDLDLDENKQAGSIDDLFAASQIEIAAPSTENKKYLDLLRYLKKQFLDAKNLGSLVEVDHEYNDVLASFSAILEEKVQNSNPSVRHACRLLSPIVEQASVLAKKYYTCIANPPYIGSGGMNADLKCFAKDNYPDSKSDLFSIYIERCLGFTSKIGKTALVTPYVWMFIGSYSKLRTKLLTQNTLESLVQLEYNAFAPACIPVCTYIINKGHVKNFTGSYIRLSEFKGHENQAPKTKEAILNKDCGWFYTTKPDNFSKIAGSPIGYWLDDRIFESFEKNISFKDKCYAGFGIKTGNNDLFMREWHEVSFSKTNLEQSQDEVIQGKWFPCASGGSFRKWYGNQNLVVNYENSGKDIELHANQNGNSYGFNGKKYYFKRSITWPKLTSSINSFRATPQGHIFDGVGLSAFFDDDESYYNALGLLNSNLFQELIAVVAPTLSFTTGDFLKLPYVWISELPLIVKELVGLHQKDWDAQERSWNFKRSSLVSEVKTLSTSYDYIKQVSTDTVERVSTLERRLNELVNQAFGVEDIIESRCREEQISINSNPEYSYKTNEEYSVKQSKSKSSTLAQLISYSIGCMMGRYSLDREGLVYAHAGNQGFKELVAEGAYNTFPADEDGIIPLAAEDWLFEDDATSRFRDFVKTVWGEEHLQENLDFVAESLCLDAIKPRKNESSMETIRRYFSTQFYKDHLKTYKKRPIYWLFSSGKEKAFECLVYLHRYNESTLARMRTEYVTPLMGKLETQHSVLTESRTNASSTEQRRIDKELKSIEKKQSELRAFDEELKHLAEMKISIDLDDGVKVNYGKFGNLLADVKAIHGKKPEELK
ncbi:BREX-1 system adenine-specific DNA-methyltransferase PglX [Vibrio cyclitrophicus]